MLDFVFGLFLAALLVRGWTRGFVREALDLVGLVVGLWIAFKLSGPLGEFLITRFSVAPEVAVIGAGIVLFILFGISMSIAAHYLTKVMNLPGLSMINRVAGAAVATVWGVALLLVIINLARVMPLPGTWLQALEESSVAERVAGEQALPQKLFESIGSDDVLGSLTALQALFGSSRVVPEGNEILAIPPAPADEIRQVREEVIEVIDMVNEFRTGEGLGALGPNVSLVPIAEQRAAAMYESGRISRDTPPGETVAHDIQRAGVLVVVSGENIALASSYRAAFDAMLDSPTGLAQLLTSEYNRIGAAVVDGPTGRLVLIVFAG